MVYCASFSYFLLVIGVLVRELLPQFK
jgi:hypothetical protein